MPSRQFAHEACAAREEYLPAEQGVQVSKPDWGAWKPGLQSTQAIGPVLESDWETAFPNLPAMHAGQTVAPEEGAAVPALQGVQTLAPGVLLKRPGAQMVHA